MHINLALLMIVRNEERALPHLLESVRPHIGSWVIHDTGSTDRTVDVIEAALTGIPGRLERHEWQDFGSNRSALMKQFPEAADYALLLDADHILQVHSDKWLLAEGSDRPEADVLLIPVLGDAARYRMPYLVRRRDDYWFEGRTHEALTASTPLVAADYDGISVLHTELGGSKANKHERDIALLRADVAERPTSRAYFYLGRTLAAIGQTAEAIECYTRAEELPTSEEGRYYCALCRGRLLLLSGRNDEALAAFQQARAAYGRRAEATLDAARVLAHLGRRAEAVELLLEAKTAGVQHGNFFIEDWVTDWGIDLELAVNRWWLGEKEAARGMFQALSVRTDLPPHIAEQVKANLQY